MRLSGLMLCELMIHPARLPAVLGRLPAPIVVRLEMWVRSGPIFPEAFVPQIVWQ